MRFAASAYTRNAYREIRRSPGRFANILLLFFIGAGLFYGQQITVPSMEHSLDAYYDAANFFDIWLHEDTGFSEEDLAAFAALASAEHAQAETRFDALAQWNGGQGVIRVMSLQDGDAPLNRPTLVEGRMPTAPDECLADASVKSEMRMRIGDTVRVDGEGLSVTTLTVVGTANHPHYIEYNRGESALGSGTAECFLLVPKASFAAPAATDIFISVQGAQALVCGSEAYNQLLRTAAEEIEGLIQGGTMPALSAKALAGGVALRTREHVSGYRGYFADLRNTKNTFALIPLLIFAVALVVCSTSMMRVVEAKKADTAILSALGAHGLKLSFPFYFFSAVAGFAGSLIGCALGQVYVPGLIAGSLSQKYPVLPPVTAQANAAQMLLAVGISLCWSLLATWIAVLRGQRERDGKVRERPASIGLEKLAFLWKRLGFSLQLALKNIFRFRARSAISLFCMTACAFLVFCANSSQKTLTETVDVQYDQLQHYGLAVAVKGDTPAERAQNLDAIAGLAEEGAYVQATARVLQKGVVLRAGDAQITAELVEAEQLEAFQRFFTPRDAKTYRPVSLEGDFALLSAKAAKALGVKPGDSVTIALGAQEREVVITGLSESHLTHQLYLAPRTAGDPQTLLIQAPGATPAQITALCTDLLATGKASAVRSIEQVKRDYIEIRGSMQATMNILSAITLVFAVIILSNLNTLGKLDRARELTTLSQLGYSEAGVEAYLYRETLLLGVTGVLLAYALALLLNDVIIGVLDGVTINYVRKLYTSSFVISGCVTLAVSALASWMGYFSRRIRPAHLGLR